MSNPLAVKFGKKLFTKHLSQYQPADPLYETYVDKKGRERRRKVRTRIIFRFFQRLIDCCRESYPLVCLRVMPRY